MLWGSGFNLSMHSSISIMILSLFTVKKNNAHVMENKVSIVIFDCIYIYVNI